MGDPILSGCTSAPTKADILALREKVRERRQEVEIRERDVVAARVAAKKAEAELIAAVQAFHASGTLRA